MQDKNETELKVVKNSRRPKTDAEIVTALKSHDPDVRKLALQALFPLTKGAVLINSTKDGNEITATDNLDASRVFGAILYVAIQLGKFMGMELNWIAHPGQQQQPGIEVVPEGAMPR